MIVDTIWKHHRFDAAKLDSMPAEDVRKFSGFEMPVVKAPEGLAQASSMRGSWQKNETNLVAKAMDGRFVRTFRPFPVDSEGNVNFILGDIFSRPGLAQPLLETIRMRDDSIPMLSREKIDEFTALESSETGMTPQEKTMRRIVLLLNGDDNDKSKGLVYLLRRFRQLDETSPEFQALVGPDRMNPVTDAGILDYLHRSIALRRLLAPVSANAILRARWSTNANFEEADRAALPKLMAETLRFPFVLESLEAVGHPATRSDIVSVLVENDGIYAEAEDHFNGARIATMRDFESGRLLFEPLTSREVRRPISAMLKSALGISRQVPVAEVFRRLLEAFVFCSLHEDEIESAIGFLSWYALRHPSAAYRTAVEVDANKTDAATLLVSSIPYQRLRLDHASARSPAGRRQEQIRSATPSKASGNGSKLLPIPMLMPEDFVRKPTIDVQAAEAVLPETAPRAGSTATTDDDAAEGVRDATGVRTSMTAHEKIPDEEHGPVGFAAAPREPIHASETEDDDVPVAARRVMASWETRMRTFLDQSASYASGRSIVRASDFEVDLRIMLNDVASFAQEFTVATAPVVVDDLLARIHEVNEQIFEISGGDTEPLRIPSSGHVHPDRRPDMEAKVVEGETHTRSANDAGRESDLIHAAMSSSPISRRHEMIGRLDALTTRILADTTTAWTAISAALAHVIHSPSMPSVPVAMLPATSEADVTDADETIPDFLGSGSVVEAPSGPETAPAPPRPMPELRKAPETVSYPAFATALRHEAGRNGFDSAFEKAVLRPQHESADMAQEILQAILMPGRVQAEKFLESDVTSIFETAFLRLHDIPEEYRGTGDLLALAALEGALFNPGAVYAEILDAIDGKGPVAQAAWDVHAAIRNKISFSGIPSAVDFKRVRDVLAAREAMTRSRTKAMETIEILRNAQFSYKAAGDHRNALDKGYFADIVRGMNDAEKYREADPLVLEQAQINSDEKQAGHLLDAIAREEGVSNLERGGRIKFVKAVTDVSASAISFLQAADKSSFEGEGLEDLITASRNALDLVRETSATDPFQGAVLKQAGLIMVRFHDLVTGSARRPD